jgi:hypothetical protein
MRSFAIDRSTAVEARSAHAVDQLLMRISLLEQEQILL